VNCVCGGLTAFPDDGEDGQLQVGEVVKRLHVYMCKRSTVAVSTARTRQALEAAGSTCDVRLARAEVLHLSDGNDSRSQSNLTRIGGP
jgi:hypothetical protein